MDVWYGHTKTWMKESEMVELHIREDLTMSGRPTCYYNEKNVTCFVGASKSASITSKLLGDILRGGPLSGLEIPLV